MSPVRRGGVVILGACVLVLAGCGGREAEQRASTPCDVATFVAPAGIEVGALYGVDAATESDVWAVGTDNASGEGSGRSLVLHWDGKRWSRVASPSPDHELTALWDVVAVSVADAWAVGVSGNGGLIEHWNGDAWTDTRLDLPAGFLTSVDAVTEDDIWAVGSGGPTYDPKPVVLHWDGEQWQKKATP